MLGAFEFSLLKFDVGYPTGEKHKSFGTFALQSVGLPNLLAAEVNHLTDRLHMCNTFLGEDQGLRGQGQPGRGWEVSGAQICIEHDIEHVEHWDSTPFTSTLAGLVWAKRRLGCPRLCCSRGWRVGGWRRWQGGTFNTQDLKWDHESKMNVRYGGDYTMASLRLFLASKAGLSITMEGCIKWGNNLSKPTNNKWMSKVFHSQPSRQNLSKQGMIQCCCIQTELYHSHSVAQGDVNVGMIVSGKDFLSFQNTKSDKS